MIIRLFHARVKPGKQAQFKGALEQLSIPNIRSRSGMVAIYPGQPHGTNSNEFVLVTVWKDQASLERYSQANWAKAIIPQEVFPLLEEWHDQDYQSFGVYEEPLKPFFQNI